jgi:hypothetical protein
MTAMFSKERFFLFIFGVLILFVQLFFVLPPVIAQNPRMFYVSPNGDDTHAGTRLEPFQTLQRARDAVRQVNKTMQTDIVVCLRQGVYRLSEPLQFDRRDGGSNGYRVIWRACDEETAVIRGGSCVGGWRQEEAMLVSADLPQHSFRQLYVNGKRAIRAREPDQGAYYRLKDWQIPDQKIRIAAEQIRRWKQFNRVEMIAHLHWAEAIMRLQDVEQEGGDALITIQEPERHLVFLRDYPIKSPKEPFHFENALEFLDQPGEWYLDEEGGRLFYKPRPGETAAGLNVVAPQVQTLFTIAGEPDRPVEHLEFHRLRFQYSNWTRPSRKGHLTLQAFQYTIDPTVNNTQYVDRPPAAVYVRLARNVVFKENVFQHLGATALDLHYGTDHCQVIGNVFSDISGNGITLATFSNPDVRLHVPFLPENEYEICRHDRIENNYIEKIGQDYYGAVGIACGYPQNVLIEHNELFDMPYTGISIGWGWTKGESAMKENMIRFNHIHHVANLLADGGGIYTLSRQPGSVIRENYIHHIIKSEWAVGSDVNGVFMDEGTDGYTCEHNIIQHTPAGAFRFHRTGTLVFKNEGITSDPAVMENAGLTSGYDHIKEWKKTEPEQETYPSLGR